MHPGFFADATPRRNSVISARGAALTYRDLEDASNRLAHVFRSAGLQRGDHIAFTIENRPEFFVVVWAAQRAGLYYTPCSTRLTADELQYIVNDCQARLFVATAETFDVASMVSAPAVERRLLLDRDANGWERLESVMAEQPCTPIDDQVDGAYMLYSSGTTGVPRGVKPPLPTSPYPQPASGLAELFDLDEETVYLSPAPLYHAAPLGFTLMVQRVGGTVVLQERFDPEEFLALIERHRVTFTQVVPTMFIRLLKLPDDVRARYDLSSLKGVVHGAAPCPVGVKEQMIEWLGPIIHEYYSATEGIGFVYCDSEEWLAHKGTVGQSLLGPMHILDDGGAELPAGETGTVYFENSNFEYHGDAAKTDKARDVQGRGWSTLGDIGHVDHDGFLYLTDRKAYTIISGGVNIYPQEAENVLSMHPAVADVAVFGIPDEEMGERVHGVVLLTPDNEPSAGLEAQLIEYCRSHLAAFKCPRAIEFRDELPRHDTGKLYKRLLKDEYWQGRSLTGA